MKKLSILLILIFIFILLFNGYSVKATYEKDKIKEIDKELLHNLLTKRTEIMNEGIYNCDNIDKIIEELKNIEKGSILKEDILSLNEILSNPTDYPKVNNVRIKDVSDIKYNENIYEVSANILWNISYNLEDNTEEYEYIIKIEIQDNKFFLMDFKLKE